MVLPEGRTKGLTLRGKGNVVLVAAQLEDADGNPTEEYVLLRADEFGRLRTVDAGATFLGLTDTPGSYAGQGGLFTRVNVAEDALEFVGALSHAPMAPQMNDLGETTWGMPGWGILATSATIPESDSLFYTPIYVERSRTFTQLGIHVTVAGVGGTVARLGIYAATFDGSGDLTPDTLTLDAGTVAVDTTGLKSIAISQVLAEGFHFLAYSSDGGPTNVHPDRGEAITVPVTSRLDQILGQQFIIQSVAVVDGAAALPSPATAPVDNRSISRACVFIGE